MSRSGEIERKSIAQQELDRLTRGEGTPFVGAASAERMALGEKEASFLISMTFMSRSDGARPHVVTLRPDGTTQCTCQANHECWGQRAFRMVIGMR